jgi:hypothetical protein
MKDGDSSNDESDYGEEEIKQIAIVKGGANKRAKLDKKADSD